MEFYYTVIVSSICILFYRIFSYFIFYFRKVKSVNIVWDFISFYVLYIVLSVFYNDNDDDKIIK